MDGLRAVTLLALALPNAGAFSAFATSVSRPLPLASHPQTCGHAPRAIAPLERRAAAAAVCMASSAAEEEKLPPAVRAITLTVLAQMIGEGIALTSLPLHMKTLGASTVMSGVAVSGFSLSSLIFTPLVVSLSEQTGRFRMLRVCLFGCALAQLIIVQATKPVGVVVGRFLCGIFAASVPVAQAAVTDLVTSSQSALALSRVSAVSQAGVVVGPAIGAVAISILNGLGVPDVRGLHMRCVFASSATFALAVLAGQIALGVVAKSPGDESADSDTDGSISTSGRRRSDALPLSSKATEAVEKLPLAANVRTGDMLAQWALRFVAISLGWGLTLSMATYSLFGSMIVGYTQQQLSINFSAAAALAVRRRRAHPASSSRSLLPARHLPRPSPPPPPPLIPGLRARRSRRSSSSSRGWSRSWASTSSAHWA
jgi:MFS family permease